MDTAELERRFQYIRDEAEDAGLTSAQTNLAITAAMSTGDFLDADSFELMVNDVIQGANES